VSEVPDFRGEYDEHIDSHGELLDHVLMGDVTRFIIRTYRESLSSASDLSSELLKAMLSMLEAGIESDSPYLQELIGVSFLENLHQAEDDFDGLAALLGPELRRRL
jgi:hypothetical protein